MQRRQQLEAYETSGATVSPFLSGEEAEQLMRRARREVGVLSYGWLQPGDPDPFGTTMRAVRDALRANQRIVAIFWDFGCLPQRPRTPLEDAAFAAALDVMGDLYASAVGSTVLQLRAISPKPCFYCGTYNARPYENRGWCIFEDAVSMEAVARLRYYPELQKAVETLPPKLIVIGQTPAATLEYELNAPSRIAQVVESIEGAKFTGKGDQAKVSWLYRDYVARVTNMANSTGAAEACEYEGSRNASGQEEGRGISRYASGNTYEGEFKAGLRDGFGVYTYNVDKHGKGNSFAGEWKANQAHGHGRVEYVSGDVYDGQFVSGQRCGTGKWSNHNGETYEGEWANNAYHGFGTLHSVQGEEYKGQFNQGKMEGQGRQQAPSGDVYEGEWKQDKFDGLGTLTLATGTATHGQWKAGVLVEEQQPLRPSQADAVVRAVGMVAQSSMRLLAKSEGGRAKSAMADSRPLP